MAVGYKILCLFGVDIRVPSSKDGQDSDDGDATKLTLGPITMKQRDSKKRKADDDSVHGKKKKQWFRILRLFGTDIRVSYNLDKNSCDHPSGVVLDPLPLRQFVPKQGILQQDYGAEFVETSTNKASKKTTGKRKAMNNHVVSPYHDGRKKRKQLKKRFNIDDLPIPSLDGFPRLQSILRQQGIKPKFLYRKWIEESDINKDLNRLLLVKSDTLMDIMTEEERGKMVTEKDGFEVSGFDSEGRDYNLHIKKWKSQTQPILNKGSWRNLLNNNNVGEGQMIEIWGERRNEELVFIINFRKAEAEQVQSNAGSSSSSLGGARPMEGSKEEF